ncbi:hypothetical protein [Occallatibacter savannae]|uniref:hypothetical protein n=1 Tax=Occallatibacter savannae TaxID=1002691 RepID=UPI0013A567E7|nr:hypothetical protein [Occallatibacter savannae]
MRKHCKEGLRLYNSFMKVLKEWGLAEADRQAVEIMPLGLVKLKEISQAARKADSLHIIARRAYAEHISECLVCSRHLVAV